MNTINEKRLILLLFRLRRISGNYKKSIKLIKKDLPHLVSPLLYKLH